MKSVLTFVGLSLTIAAGWLVVTSQMAHASVDPYPLQPVGHDPFDASRKDADVAFHEGRVKRDPGGAIGWAMLSGAYLSRSREIDSYADANKAEQAARKSLALRTKGNLGGQTRLVNSLLQEHRFMDALAADEKALKLWGQEPELTQLHADIEIEIGRYKDAQFILDQNPSQFDYPSGTAVAARLELMEGRPEQALGLLKKAYADVDANAGATDENLAWFEEKIGECLMMLGKPDGAQKAFEKAIQLYPKGYKSFANLCRLAASRGDWSSVVSYGNQSNDIAAMPDILALVGDAYAQQGKPDLAEKQYRAVVALAGKPSGPSNGLHEFAGASGGHGHTLDRQYAMFCADHDRDLDGGYACALRELQDRRDVYAFDTMAWVCFKRGDKVEAKEAIEKALSAGTRDARIFYHAAVILSTTGNAEESNRYLAQAQSLPGTLSLLETKTMIAMEAKP